MTARYPGGSGTYSKCRSQFPGNAPQFAVSGKGSHIVGSDGRTYLDYTMALGAISLGYSDEDVNEAVRRQLEMGTIFGLPAQIEFDFADEIGPFLPWADYGVKYGKHGSDITQAAVRAARFITGRRYILSQGYHGWGDAFCPNPNGVPSSVRWLTTEWEAMPTRNDLGSAAAVIVEPDGIDDLAALRAVCSDAGTLLIFDEVLTGGRCPGFTYSKWKGVIPDFICLAKAISNGVPLSVIAGKSEYMKVFAGDIGYSFTYGGECTSLAAGIATLRKYAKYPVINRLWIVGDELRTHWRAETTRLGVDIPLLGLSPRTVFKYASLAQRTLVSQEFVRRGILVTVGFTACFANTVQDIYETKRAISEVLEVVASAGDTPERLVEGPIVGLPFKAMTTL